MRERKMQRALMQFFKAENYFEVREALREAGRQDLIGSGCDCLIPAQPPKEAIARRRRLANTRFRGEYVHQIDGPKLPSEPAAKSKRPGSKGPDTRKKSRHAPGRGYRPHRGETRKDQE
jgi:hypothetical protein